MFGCSYIITLYNQEETIPFLIESLKKIKGIFRKEFIFINDGSTDNSLDILKANVGSLPHVMIISNPHIGPTESIKGIKNLIRHDYIHFLDGNTIVSPFATKAMIEASIALDTQIAISSIASDSSSNDNNAFNQEDSSISELEPSLITDPIKEILLDTNPYLLFVGNSNSVIHRDLLLAQIDKIDTTTYLYNISLSLLCAQSSNFAYVPTNLVKIISQTNDYTKNFLLYNQLLSTYNFVGSNADLFQNLTSELLQFLSRRKNQHPFQIQILRLIKKFKTYSVNDVLNLYSQEINHLLKKISGTT